MSSALDAEVSNDGMAVSMAKAVAIANRRAVFLGIDLQGSFVSAAQKPSKGGVVWRVSYIPRDYIGKRGGGFMIEVDPADGSIRRELRGQ